MPRIHPALPLLALALAACAANGGGRDSAEGAAPAAPSAAAAQETLPADATTALARLNASPRHGEYAMVAAGAGDSVRAWVVYPERAEKAPVVLVVHEIYGLTHWIRAVADQLAAEGFIAIAPDLLSGHAIPEVNGEPDRQAATAAVRVLARADVHRRLKAVATWGMALPAATQRYGIVGFCWGGSTSFVHAIEADAVDAAVVYYGSSPDTTELARVSAPVLGLYGGADARVNATIPAAEAGLKALAKTYEPHIFDGAGHGFLRQQDGQEGANLAATRAAWPRTVAWFRQYLEE